MSERERPLHDFIDLEAYDVVPGERHRELVKLLQEAMQWIERPVATNEDAVMFLMFEERVRTVLS